VEQNGRDSSFLARVKNNAHFKESLLTIKQQAGFISILKNLYHQAYE
jgi:hypothetical protein